MPFFKDIAKTLKFASTPQRQPSSTMGRQFRQQMKMHRQALNRRGMTPGGLKQPLPKAPRPPVRSITVRGATGYIPGSLEGQITGFSTEAPGGRMTAPSRRRRPPRTLMGRRQLGA
jgi:hypothetical protein